MGDEHEAGHDPAHDDGDLRDHDDHRRATDDGDRDGDRDGDARRERAFNDQRDAVITQAEGMTQRAAEEHDARVRRDAAAQDIEDAGRTAAHPLPEARRASDAPEPPSPNHPAEELRWLEVEQRMIARALEEAGIAFEKRTIEMIAYDASNRRAVEIALRAMDALYEGGEPH